MPEHSSDSTRSMLLAAGYSDVNEDVEPHIQQVWLPGKLFVLP